MKAFRRRIVAIALLVLVLPSATGCFELEIGEVAVENNTDEVIVAWRTQVPCHFSASVGADREYSGLAPGQLITVPVFKTDLFDLQACVAVAPWDQANRSPGPVLTVPVERGRIYSVVDAGGELRVDTAGPHEEEFTFDFRIPGAVLLIFGAPFLLGAVASVGITGKFFFDYYARKRR